MAALGDSITAGNPGYDPSPNARAALGFGHDPRSQYEYWAHRDEPGLRFRNCGVFGQPTSQIATRLRSCARGADVLIVQGGINDIAQSLQSPAALRRLAVTGAATNLGRMVQQGKQLGLRVALANVLPWNRGYPVAAPLIDRLNRLIGTTAELERVPILPFNQTLADPRKPNLMQRRLTADGDHPSIAGYRRLGGVVASRLGDSR
ncbi:MAG: GDSL-type esterase/lipase family protein [Actinomycetota bacterium]|nr:GDSL-type esterase/lipase family protein [Actinomycetota bacterium]